MVWRASRVARVHQSSRFRTPSSPGVRVFGGPPCKAEGDGEVVVFGAGAGIVGLRRRDGCWLAWRRVLRRALRPRGSAEAMVKRAGVEGELEAGDEVALGDSPEAV